MEKLESRRKKLLLNIYLTICKKENHIFDLIYRYHGCDSWEDIFRDYDERDLREKAEGVEIAIKTIEEIEDDKEEDNQYDYNDYEISEDEDTENEYIEDEHIEIK